ncbi:RagB/SusD family nutrient uptake outer membrane protein [Niabella sp. CC-SYL272]|uniref:RagB/SusD family nutrient uptake outer membrane protein n=1 Tax=Niabella agricola TaxID=2891571 RepID=UPI001F283D0C|nr:RagB/SusD family nutrient uptake outer membrane protein [Niabella agricola]MCF3108676.1 RagB/SusD family nutrient uptake outer membrane protein [Niabella agricola]
MRRLTDQFISLTGIITVKTLVLFLTILLYSATGCKKSFLDVVPDNVATLENAFENRKEAEKYLATCYSYLPEVGPLNILFFGSDDIWSYSFNNASYNWPWKIAMGEQNIVGPYVNFWDGENSAIPYFKAIRDCNIFLEHMVDETGRRRIVDLNPEEQQRWIGEVKFLKAFYHFYLMRMYGPIPIVDKNLPIAATPAEVKVKRVPFDSCVNYVAGLLDEAAVDLPLNIKNRTTEYGRATKSAALFLKTKLLVMAASPLFNGNPDYAGFKDKDGVALFNPVNDAAKWQRAAAAGKEAVAACNAAGFQLYQFTGALTKLSDTTTIQLSIRGSVSAETDKNTEAIWALTGRNGGSLQNYAMPHNIDPRYKDTYLASFLSPTLKMAEMFYTDHGVPIDEDKTWNFSQRYTLRTAVHEERFNIQEGYTTAYLNFNRENRFYANLGFDGGIWYLQSSPSGTDENTFFVQAKKGQLQGQEGVELYNVTGYWAKNLTNWRFTQTQTSFQTQYYAWPVFKLDDLLLLYAEALNETGNADDAIDHLDRIRARAGLEGVRASWTKYATNPDKFTTKEGLRKIIQRERAIELCFQGERIWDLRRWKQAVEMQNQPVRGWDISQKTAALYYRPVVIHNQKFIAPRDYLWPVKEYNLTVNTNLVQNPGW